MKVIIANLAFVMFLVACGAPEPEIIEDPTPEPTEEVEETPAPEPEEDPTVEETELDSDVTVEQENAVRSAENYLSFTSFSREGLVEQLKFEGFSSEDAEFAVSQLDVDYYEQAEKTAMKYQDMTGMSRDGLIGQLEFDGYTREQAEHGADSVGL